MNKSRKSINMDGGNLHEGSDFFFKISKRDFTFIREMKVGSGRSTGDPLSNQNACKVVTRDQCIDQSATSIQSMLNTNGVTFLMTSHVRSALCTLKLRRSWNSESVLRLLPARIP